MARPTHVLRKLIRNWKYPGAYFDTAFTAEVQPPVGWMRILLAGWGLAALMGDLFNLGSLHGTGPLMAGVFMTGPLLGLLCWLCLSAGLYLTGFPEGKPPFRRVAVLCSHCFGPLCLLSLLQFAGLWLGDGTQMEGRLWPVTVLSLPPLVLAIHMGTGLVRRPKAAAWGIVAPILAAGIIIPTFLFAQLANVSLF